jgi:hypothetical protein
MINPLRVIPVQRDSDVLGDIRRWFEEGAMQDWMDRFDFDGFTANLGTSCVEGFGTDRLTTLGWTGLDTSDRPVAFLGGDVLVHHAGTLVKSADGFVERSTRTPPTLGFFYIVSPDHRNLGYGREIVRSVLRDSSSAKIEVFSCHVDLENNASLAVMRGIPEFERSAAEGGKESYSYTRDRQHREDHEMLGDR